ncbi:MAG: hypothetical protein R2688_08405 [Fimbriimonadaceae bacterium]
MDSGDRSSFGGNPSGDRGTLALVFRQEMGDDDNWTLSPLGGGELSTGST